MIPKLLIANRGEIACRVITTARKLGIKTVAVYSDADANSKHVAMADEAVHIGPSEVSESYLKGDRIIAAALETGASAIHPGYGFLSENPDFVDAIDAAGLIFVGPPADAIRAMGLKDAAKALMVKAGVPVVPGYHGDSQDPDFLAAEADKIGYPVLIKARAGGGGKGMRLVEDPADFKSALEGAQREGAASFGDPICLIEKFITSPRHIEIQVFGDSLGDAIHLFERDCSLQRRHQKVIEEAPAPDMPENVRAAMGKAATDAARAIGYVGAGTVEFIVDGSGPLREDGFWFMEMNTRLQVEHPISEAITGLDFVELQLRVASGEPLGIAQFDLSINGWAFEARVYAEDVPKGFLPATGTLDHLAFPDGTAFELGTTRIDSGVRQGDDISPWYDPMIAKVIVHGPTRQAALMQLSRALDACEIQGSVTNLEFLGALARHDGFARGEFDTGLIARDLDALTAQTDPGIEVLGLAALGVAGLLDPKTGTDPWATLTGFSQWEPHGQTVVLSADDTQTPVTVTVLGSGKFSISSGAASTTIEVIRGETSHRVRTDRSQYSANVVANGPAVSVFVDGRTYAFTRPDPLAAGDGDHLGGDAIIAPMPGLVTVVLTEPGATVAMGDPLIVLEAMKMEHTLNAPRDGVIGEILFNAGDQVSDGTLLLSLEPEND